MDTNFGYYIKLRPRLPPDSGSKEVGSSRLTKGCKDCEAQFRHDVLIDRLVTDSLLNKPWKAAL